MPTSTASSKAKSMIATLDKASGFVENARKGSKSDNDVVEFNKALKQLATTRSLLSLIKTQTKFQIDVIREVLLASAEVLDQLVRDLKEGEPESIGRKVHNAAEDLDGETKNLQSLLPGLYVEAISNDQKETNDYQYNGPVVEKVKEGQLEGGTFIARGNVAAGKNQYNSLVQKKLEAEKTKSKEMH